MGDIKFGIVPDANGRNFEASLPSLKLDDITPNTLDDLDAARYLSLRNTVAALSSLRTLEAHWEPIYDVHMAMRRKVVVNAVINPLTALMDCTNGEALNHTWGKRICRLICEEASKVFQAQWYAEVQAAKRAGQTVKEEKFPGELTASALEDECHRIANITSTNYSSMLIEPSLPQENYAAIP